MAIRKKSTAVKKLEAPSDVDRVVREIRRAGIVAGVLSLKGAGADLTAGLTNMVDNIEEALDAHFD